MVWVKRILVGSGGLLVALILALVIAGCALHRSLPDGPTGQEADALAKRMLQAVHDDAWDQVGAIEWTFVGRNKHLWDRKRNFARIRWGSHEVLVDVASKKGVARTNGKAVSGEAGDKLVQDAWAHWANDSFWLNPVTKAFDEGTTRKLIKLEDGTNGVLVTYSSGGVTPGDSYLWLLAKDGKPRAWRMWVKIVPVGGVEFEWKNWIKLPGGALIALDHDGLFDVNITELRAAFTLEELFPGKDPFAELVALKTASR